jgi:hypothetical protein
MKETAIEWLINEMLKHDKSFVDYYNTEIEQAKEMEKENTCYFGAKCCIMTTQKKKWSLEELFNETFKTK